MSLSRALRLSTLFIVLSGLVACGDGSQKPGKTPESSAAQSKQGKASKASDTQAEIEKFNTYVDAANGINPSFGNAVDDYEEAMEPKLKAAAPLQYFVIRSDASIDRTIASLNKALAMKPPMPEIDAAAKALSETLGKLAPLSHELENYASSKGYLSDDGKLAREKGPAYVAALKEAAKQESVFGKSMSEKDMANIKRTFEAAKPDSLAYYRAGLVFHGKSVMKLADAVLEGKDPASQDAFKAALDKTNEMAVGFGKAPKDANSYGCDGVTSSANSFVAAGREILGHIKDGTYKKEAEATDSPTWVIKKISRDVDDLERNFGSLISALNRQGC